MYFNELLTWTRTLLQITACLRSEHKQPLLFHCNVNTKPVHTGSWAASVMVPSLMVHQLPGSSWQTRQGSLQSPWQWGLLRKQRTFSCIISCTLDLQKYNHHNQSSFGMMCVLQPLTASSVENILQQSQRDKRTRA